MSKYFWVRSVSFRAHLSREGESQTLCGRRICADDLDSWKPGSQPVCRLCRLALRIDFESVERCECGHPVDDHDQRGWTGNGCEADCPECHAALVG